MVEPISIGRHLRPNSDHFGEASFGFRRWYATLEEGQSISDCLVETFWKHVADKVQGHDQAKPKGRGDIIEVRTFDNGDYAELMIVAVSRGGLRVKLLREIKDTVSVTVPDSAPFAIKWNVGGRRPLTFSVIRKSDKIPVSEGHQTKTAALAWITDTMNQAA